jgi:AcrR family transcriptional regulator
VTEITEVSKRNRLVSVYGCGMEETAGPTSGLLDGEAPASRGGRPRDEGRDQAILGAALELIVEVGYEAMSIEAVAGRAGVSKATIYRRWPGKAQLVGDAIRRGEEDKQADPEDTGSLRGDLLAFVHMLFGAISGADGGLVCGLAVAVRSDPELGRLMAGHKQEQHRRVTSLIVSRANARGEISLIGDPPAIVDAAVGMALFRVMSGEPLTEEFAEHIVDRILIPSVSQ